MFGKILLWRTILAVLLIHENTNGSFKNIGGFLGLDANSLLRARYMIQQKINQSGMGILYLAHDEALNVDVAVKENQYSTALHSKQFHQEATLLASLRHPNLPRVIDHFVIEGQGEYLVMDYIAGENLQECLERQGKPIEEAEAIRIAAQVCDALDYLHAKTPSIIHQDIKPANLILTPEDDVMLVDFGLAKPYERGVVVENILQGITPGYSPVEQYGSETDTRSDIYSLGATLYTLLTGVKPVEAIQRAVGEDEIRPIHQINPSVSHSLRDAIRKAMAVKADDRFQSVKEFKAGLPGTAVKPDQAEIYPQENQTTRHAPESNQDNRGNKKKKKRKWLWLLPIIFIVCAASAATVIAISKPAWSRNLFQPPAATPPISTATEQLSPSSTASQSSAGYPTGTVEPGEVIPVVSATMTQTVISIRQGTPQGGGVGQIAFVSDRNGMPQIFILNLDGSELVQVTSINEGACQPEWSPDGSLLAYITPCYGNSEVYEGASIFVVNIETGDTDQVSTLGSGDYDLAWSPVGDQMAFTSLQTGRPQIFIYDFASGETHRLMNNTMVNRMPVWSPDGSQIVFVTPNPDNNRPTLFSVDSAGTGSPKTILRSVFRETFRPAWSPTGDMIIFDLGENGQIGSKQLQNNQYETIDTALEILENPGFSPDAQWLVFNGIMDTPGQDIFLMLQTGESLMRLTDSPANEYQPAWRP